jgi:hypothetical protein
MLDYEFTLAVDRDPTSLTDELFDLGHGDFVPEGGTARAVVHVNAEAETFGDALAVSVQAIEQTGLQVIGVASDDLVSIRDIAPRTARTYESVRLLAAGKRGPGGFPAPMSTGQWALYSWTEVAAWFAEHYGTEAPSAYDRQIAAADHLIRARRMLADDVTRAEFAKLLAA